MEKSKCHSKGGVGWLKASLCLLSRLLLAVSSLDWGCVRLVRVCVRNSNVVIVATVNLMPVGDPVIVIPCAVLGRSVFLQHIRKRTKAVTSMTIEYIFIRYLQSCFQGEPPSF